MQAPSTPSPFRTVLFAACIVAVLIDLCAAGVLIHKNMELDLVKKSRASEGEEMKAKVAELENSIAVREAEFRQREAQFTARFEDLRQREAAIAGREDAATERTQSSFQGLLIQQQLIKNLEALKASLPDMTPEVEKLAKEHAQLGAERQRLESENAELRRKVTQPAPFLGR